ncbi:hypothetical protein NT01EI_2000 [Edwardsiella ictaluri 93-146]|uniref:Uncharacterized protein n=1 Tax=Edwardsiella ictaluri (strain 93-146) TaxID=634503 RepID=C5BA54_EDWI9|nr:hypothetical protein NT01EI_2000 [Edwardsiella ictaluri 93-146]
MPKMTVLCQGGIGFWQKVANDPGLFTAHQGNINRGHRYRKHL